MVPGDKCWVMFGTYCLEITITQEAKIIHSKKVAPMQHSHHSTTLSAV